MSDAKRLMRQQVTVSPRVAEQLRRLNGGQRLPGLRVKGELSGETVEGARTSADSTLRGSSSYYGSNAPLIGDQEKSGDRPDKLDKPQKVGRTVIGARTSGNAREAE